jgi:hypothetical protein
MICRTLALSPQRSWSLSVWHGPESRRIVAPGHELVKPASVPKSPATRSRLWETSHYRLPVFFTSTSALSDPFLHQRDTHTASQQLIASHVGQKLSPSQTSRLKQWHALSWLAGYHASVVHIPSSPTRDVNLSPSSSTPWPNSVAFTLLEQPLSARSQRTRGTLPPDPEGRHRVPCGPTLD